MHVIVIPEFYFRWLSWNGPTPGICDQQPSLPSRWSEHVPPASKIRCPAVWGTTWQYFRSASSNFPPACIKLKPRNVYPFFLHEKLLNMYIISVSNIYIMNNKNCYVSQRVSTSTCIFIFS